jgi:putative sigma-54 modulation protein
MRMKLTGQHVEITDSIRDYVAERFTRLDRHLATTKSAHIVLTTKKSNIIARAKLHTKNGKVVATCENKNMQAAIESMVTKLCRQLSKKRDKARAV